MEKMVTRAYNQFEINETLGAIRKLSTTERLRDEILYYILLQKNHPDQAILFPRLIDYKQPLQETFWMDLELYDYANLGNYIFGNHQLRSWEEVFTKLKTILSTWENIKPLVEWTDEDIRNATYNMYIEKTETEFNKFYTTWRNEIDALAVNDRIPTIIINKKTYNNFFSLWPMVKNYIEKNMLSFVPSLIHGDFCLSNILYGPDKNIIRFIDPRGSFGKVGIYGDIRYDVAKLYHSVDGTYEAFINDRFEVIGDGNVYQLIKENNESSLALKQFEKVFFPTFKKKDIKIIQGCIFIGMCARHYDSLERQKAMYLTGIRLLNQGVNEA